MFSKVLIANRGEIACRVMATCRRLGIATVAIHSDVDADSLHVRTADEAVCVGAAAPTHSYLNSARIIEACLQTKAEAVHPGYGFLSENAVFAQALSDAGVCFIGPKAAAITAMGDKIGAKRRAAQAGVAILPGYTEALRDAEHALAVAADIGYPVMLKASAGGGGKGMRIVRDAASCREDFVRAQSEARTSFGDDRMMIEKFIAQPRHIEVQVLADSHGKMLCLGERECSIQRRHQKLIEESPSPFLADATRRAMSEQAMALARAVDYVSAGTVEFVVDREQRFYFLEMNTRLQVEHPVTECVTRLDLVELMLRIAAGEHLALEQADIKHDGWAIEGRIYSESPERGFLPATGRITHYVEPPRSPTLRLDSGVYEGAAVSIHYDPMIAKLITRGATRLEAIEHMRAALDAYCIRGLDTNIAFLSSVVAHSRFQSGDINTQFIAEAYGDSFTAQHKAPRQPTVFAVMAVAIHHRYQLREQSQDSHAQSAGSQSPPSQWVARIEEHHWSCSVSGGYRQQRIECDEKTWVVDSDWQYHQPLFKARINDHPYCVKIQRENLNYRLAHGGSEALVLVLSPRQHALYGWMPPQRMEDKCRFLLSPMPGLLSAVMVAAGDRVKAGQPLAIIDAMKMENVLHAPQDQVVRKVLAAAATQVEVDQAIIEFE